jgi:hypothetical protein
VGDVVSQAGSIKPGLPLGTLTASSVTMDARSGLTIEVGGTAVGTFDQLAVTGNVSYAGSLTVTNVPPFTGGLCGQVVPVITDHSSGARGAFSKIFGLVQGPVFSWRIYNPANLFELVGYAPQSTIFVNESSLDVTEGGGSTRYQVCLGPTRPTADVVVSLSRALDQIEVGPATMTFTVATWLLPQTVTVTPLNDGVIESLHSDTVLSVVTSGDATYDGTFVAPLPVVINDNDGSASLSASGPPERAPFMHARPQASMVRRAGFQRERGFHRVLSSGDAQFEGVMRFRRGNPSAPFQRRYTQPTTSFEPRPGRNTQRETSNAPTRGNSRSLPRERRPTINEPSCRDLASAA